MKKCTMCCEDVPKENFSKHSRAKDGLQGNCKPCMKEYRKNWREKDPERARKRKLMSKYGITTKQYNEMLKAQNNGCKICGSEEPRNKSSRYLYVDHCHQSGIIRGLLCDYCNVGLGRFEDDIDRLKKAVQYLRDAYAE